MSLSRVAKHDRKSVRKPDAQNNTEFHLPVI